MDGLYFVINKFGDVNSLKTPTPVNYYITETFYQLLNKQDQLIFQVFFDAWTQFTREKIYNGIRSNLENYNLKPFYAGYKYLEIHYVEIHSLTQDITQKI